MKEPKFKLICIDLDGTLLSDDKKIPTENIKAIQEAINSGVKICIATGRIYKFVDHIKDKISNKIEVIASNGALIVNNREFILNYLSYNEVLKIKDIAKDYDLEMYLNTEDTIISEGSIPESYTYKITNERLEDKYKVNFLEKYSFERLIEDNKYNILKVVLMNKNKLEEIRKVRDALEKSGEFEICSSEPQFCEVNSKGISKGRAVEELAKELGIDIKDVICIGDGGNDLEMLKRAGLSVAMANAPDEVKNIANYITESNNESGVSKAIKKLILENINY
ncbi:Cof-type HAD-IIB family hydrolase [Clostridium sp.]|uniref:Cof-type HAD-IIB family hydrolase n=1 Tax=Clostridium sp. TaxID=1506 RepID=UPI001D93752F|nr:Cof-type HAD-IIB family hydrolase [Clostridium sp.]MBS5938534.1 HAD family phosphatase [Clostridium sp.]